LPTGTDEEGKEVTFYVSGTSLSVNTGFMVTSWEDATKDKAYFDKNYSVYISDDDPDDPSLELIHTSTGDVYRWIYSTIEGMVDV